MTVQRKVQPIFGSYPMGSAKNVNYGILNSDIHEKREQLSPFSFLQTGSCLNRTALPYLDFHTSQNTSEFVLLYIFLQQGQTGDCFYQKI